MTCGRCQSGWWTDFSEQLGRPLSRREVSCCRVSDDVTPFWIVTDHLTLWVVAEKLLLVVSERAVRSRYIGADWTFLVFVWCLVLVEVPASWCRR